MRAGRLRHKVTIEQPTETQDSQGQPVKTWSTFAQVFAGVEPLRGREFFDAQQINAETMVKFVIRHLDNVTQKMRISYDSKLYNINAIINVNERDREMHLMCSEGVNDG